MPAISFGHGGGLDKYGCPKYGIIISPKAELKKAKRAKKKKKQKLKKIAARQLA
ncbi:MAG: hypothetical protein ACR2RB_13775 [Gammaproteobacteria bacterium]